jgi:hypothetical protein
VGKVPIEAEVLAELERLMDLVKRMISGESMRASSLVNFDEEYGKADIASITEGENEFIFISAEGDDSLDNYIELRSTRFPEMAITLPSPTVTRMGEKTLMMSDDALAKWRQDLC